MKMTKVYRTNPWLQSPHLPSHSEGRSDIVTQDAMPTTGQECQVSSILQSTIELPPVLMRGSRYDPASKLSPKQLAQQSLPGDRCQAKDWRYRLWEVHQDISVKVAAQLQVNNEDSLTRLGQREQDVPSTYTSNHRDYRSAAGTTNLATDHQVGS